MKTVNKIKDIAIIVDLIISIIASSIQASNPQLSGALFGLSAIVLIVAAVCVIIGFIKKK